MKVYKVLEQCDVSYFEIRGNNKYPVKFNLNVGDFIFLRIVLSSSIWISDPYKPIYLLDKIYYQRTLIDMEKEWTWIQADILDPNINGYNIEHYSQHGLYSVVMDVTTKWQREYKINSILDMN